MHETQNDPELEAINQVIKAIGNLDKEARSRVISYVFNRLGLSVGEENTSSPKPLSALTSPPVASVASGSAMPMDIRMLKETKKPKNDVEMACLVAFYLRELAPTDERKESIERSDVEKYFKHANYPLPKQPRMVLGNAKQAGYLDNAGWGTYKLNPVGYNLIAHGLTEASGRNDLRKSKKKTRTKAKK